jgi:hypothetical protein
MKQSICEYFHRANELCARWETVRTDVTSAGFGDGGAIDSAVDAIATACGSYA